MPARDRFTHDSFAVGAAVHTFDVNGSEGTRNLAGGKELLVALGTFLAPIGAAPERSSCALFNFFQGYGTGVNGGDAFGTASGTADDDDGKLSGLVDD